MLPGQEVGGCWCERLLPGVLKPLTAAAIAACGPAACFTAAYSLKLGLRLHQSAVKSNGLYFKLDCWTSMFQRGEAQYGRTPTEDSKIASWLRLAA